MVSIELLPLCEQDIDHLTLIMTRSFNKDSQEFLGCDDGPPGYDDGTFLRRWGLHPESSAFKIIVSQQLVGAVILWIKPDHHNSLGCLFLDYNFQDKGLGLRVWQTIERNYPDTKSWSTETPAFSRRNHHFYINKCGFHVIKIKNHRDTQESSYILRKEMR